MKDRHNESFIPPDCTLLDVKRASGEIERKR